MIKILHDLYLNKKIISPLNINKNLYILEINKSKLNCLCQNINLCVNHNEILLDLCLIIKNKCKFCKFRTVYDLYEKIKKLDFPKIKKIIGFTKLVADNKTSQIILSKYSYILTFDEINELINKNNNIEINNNVINRMLYVIDQHKTCNIILASELLQKIIKMDNFINTHHDKIIFFLINIINNNESNKLEILKLNNTTYGFILENMILTNKLNYFDIILEKSEEFKMNPKNFKALRQLTCDKYEKILEKLINIIEYINYINIITKLQIKKVKIFVDPLQIELILSNNLIFDELVERVSTNVSYIKDGKEMIGIDASGLTKDFYTLVEQIMKKYFGELDNYYVPSNNHVDLKLYPNIWYNYGILCARSIFFENISPNIKIHPIICWQIIREIPNTLDELKLFFDILSIYDIEYLLNLKKIIDMSKDAYSEFLNIQGESFINKKLYIIELLKYKYVTPEILLFVGGFKRTQSKYDLTKYLKITSLYAYINGNSKYLINNNSCDSFISNLVIYGKINKSNNNVNDIAIKKFKHIFVKVLNDLNNNDVELLKKFFQFWMSTCSIESFFLKKPIISIVNYEMYDTFKSSTCFNKLYIYNEDCRGDNLESRLLILINNSVNNQILSESTGNRMQTM